MTFSKTILICLGSISLCVGALGVFVPGLPTTPFLLNSASLYLRSSDKLYQTLVTNKDLGSYIFKFRSDKGMTKRIKIYSICIMWIMLTLSCLFLTSLLLLKLLFIVLGIIGTLVMGYIIVCLQTKFTYLCNVYFTLCKLFN